MPRSSRVVALVVGLVSTLVAIAAHAQSGLQMTPDSKRVLVSKDVGNERWAIARSIGDGSVTGNVFFPSGGNPQFVWCEQTSSSADQVTLACSGSNRCLLAPCDEEAWAFIASVPLPLSFFEPRTGEAMLSCHATDQLRAVENRPSGLQLSPNQDVTLVSKDVGDERWAIARNADDGTVTGNVFFPSGGNPRFVWCQETSHGGGNLGFSCQGADACGTSCSAGDWSFIADVTLPESFFTPKAQVTIDDLVERVLETLGDDDAFVAILLGLDYGYSFVQILHAISDGRLEKSGEIRLRSGGLETPAGPPLNLFSETPSRPLAEMRSVFGLLESVKLRRVALESPFGSTTVLTMGLAKGYSTMQIVPVLAEGMWTDTLRVGGRQERGVWGIDHDNVIISAALPPVAEIAPPSGPNCNNGQIDPDEDCDGDNLGGFRCADFEGFNGGTLICTSHCSWDFRDCVKGPRPTPGASCGNGVKEPGEACDGEDFGGLTCEGIGGPAGTKLFCKDCTIDLDTSCHCDGKLCGHTCVPTGSACCGDGVAQGDEQCDGGDLRGATCASVGFAGGGTLRCTNGCALDVRACQSCDKVCPDGSCVPAGANCCGGGRFCASGTVCVAGGKCCPANLPQACGTLCIAQDAVCCGGAGFCDPGQVCAGGNRACCPKNRPQLCGAFCGPEDELCCPGGGSCPAELVCTSRPGACCTADSPQLCGDGCIPQDAVCCGGGNYCPRGSKCLDNGMCSSDTGPPSAATSSGRAASDGGPVRSGKQPAQKLHH